MTSGPSCPIGRPWARFQGSVAAWGPFYLAVRSHLCDPSKHGKPKPALIFGGEAHACAVSLGQRVGSQLGVDFPEHVGWEVQTLQPQESKVLA